MTPINDYDIYVTRMEQSMVDKLFWLNIIPKSEYSTVVDYGCADGTFLQYVRRYNSDCAIIGIDIDETMLKLAKDKLYTNAQFINAAFLSKPAHLHDEVLNLSSIIHEIYSYSTAAEIKNFWKYVKGHKYVCIRDMCIDPATFKGFEVPQLPEKDTDELARRAEFESIWGSLLEPQNFVHYMLKYRYVENWNREVRENYLPVSISELHEMAKAMGYEITYCDHFTLPFLKEKVKEDWGIDLTLPTHVKMIWKRKD